MATIKKSPSKVGRDTQQCQAYPNTIDKNTDNNVNVFLGQALITPIRCKNKATKIASKNNVSIALCESCTDILEVEDDDSEWSLYPIVSEKAAQILRTAVARLEKKPKSFDMDKFFDFVDSDDLKKDLKKINGNKFNLFSGDFCNTTCCLAGQIIIDQGAVDEKKLFEFVHQEVGDGDIEDLKNEVGYKPSIKKNYIELEDVFVGSGKLKKIAKEEDYDGIAREILEIDDDAGQRLFFSQEWPAEFNNQYETATTPKQRAKALKNRVEHFIKTGE